MNLIESYNLAPTDITREFFFNVGGVNGFMRWGIYLFMLISFSYLIFNISKKVKIWKMGQGKLNSSFPGKRVKVVIKNIFFQSKILKEGFAGIMHASFFFGFLGLFIVTMIIVVQEDITGLFFDYHFIYGNFYLFWSLCGDLFGLVVFSGIIMAMYRRYILRPSRLDTKRTDTFALIFILLLIITGFINESIRIAITGFPKFEVWSPVGYILARPFSVLSIPALEIIHKANWWIHMIGSFVFLGLIGNDKLGHIVISFLNVYFMNIENVNPDTKYTVPLIHPDDFEEKETFGVASVEEFTRKQLMSSDACTRCGRCQDVCPAYLTEKPLSPKKLINDIKDNMDERIPRLIKAEDPSTVETTPLIEGSVKADEFWSCTNCAACMEACPVEIEHVPAIIDMRRYNVLMEAKISSELNTSYTNMERNFNPYGFGFATRGDWLPEELGVKTLSEDPDVDYCYFVGCAASFDKRNQKIATAFINIMKKAGIKVGILGAEEACCGDPALRGGNEYLFHAMAAQNLETFNNYGIKKFVTACPHCFNTLKKEYRKFAAVGKNSDDKPLEYEFDVYHHTEIISDLIRTGKIKLKEPLVGKITYHDSCFLGRYNEIYNRPRDIIKAVPGAELVEMSRAYDRSFCCGAGGARMFIEEHLGTRVNQFRTKDAHSSGAGKICTACPFCMTMLSDGATELELAGLETYDVAELVYNSMGK